MKNRISLGNKAIGIISFVSVISLAILLAVISFDGYLLIISFLLVLIYSFQASKISYIKVSNRQFVIENVFKKRIIKDLKTYRKVSRLGFSNLMEIEFSDNSKYYFWGKSEKSIDTYIKQLM